jgi:hypothetical protein
MGLKEVFEVVNVLFVIFAPLLFYFRFKDYKGNSLREFDFMQATFDIVVLYIWLLFMIFIGALSGDPVGDNYDPTYGGRWMK